jgi:crotonobetaine/carnitine-CoA ligase
MNQLFTKLGAIDDSTTVPRVFASRAEQFPDKPFISFTRGGGAISYSELMIAAEAGAARLRREFKIEPGTTAAIFLSNRPSFIRSWFSSLFAGLVDIPLNYEFKKDTLRFGLEATDARVVFTDADGAERLLDPDVSPCTAKLRLIVLTDGADPAPLTEALKAMPVRPAFTSLEELIAPGPHPNVWEHLKAFDLASIRFTSGTTGSPKGIMHSHAQMLNKSANHVRVLEYTSADTLYTPFPLHHSLASTMGMMGTVQAGGTMVSAPRFSASRYWLEAKESGATIGHILFPLIPMLLAQAPSDADHTHRVRHLWTAWPHHEFEARFNTKLIQIYALAEIGLVAYQRGGREEQSHSVGKPLAHMQVQIVDEFDRALPVGQEGEITLRPGEPHHVMLGYYKNLAATQRAFRNLWLHTGDRGFIDDKGELHFLGRIGDTIRRRGVNISSDQIDEVALRNSEVQECASIGVPSALGEEDIKMFVVWKRPPADRAEAIGRLLEFMRERLPKQYLPRYVEIAQELPRTNTGKFRKTELRERPPLGPIWDEEARTWTK